MAEREPNRGERERNGNGRSVELPVFLTRTVCVSYDHITRSKCDQSTWRKRGATVITSRSHVENVHSKRTRVILASGYIIIHRPPAPY